jgi:hypothetical protein
VRCFFGDDIPAIATIGFGEFERRPEMGLLLFGPTHQAPKLKAYKPYFYRP